MSRQLVGRVAAVVGVVVLVALLAVVGRAWWDSRLPGTYNVMSYGSHDYGGGPVPPDHTEHGGGTSVADLREPSHAAPDDRFVLTARAADISVSPEHVVHALTFNGISPGPELHVHEGDLVEVVLRNEDVTDGVTIHWHGIEVPDAEDGVAGVTQNAVLPGGSYTYRFRATDAGTYWYHSHQVSSEEVQRGLFGAIVVQSAAPAASGVDRTLAAHTFDGITTLSGRAGAQPTRVAPGTAVRLRLVNTDSAMRRFSVAGTAFRVLAIDGRDLNAPGLLEHVGLPLAAGGRYDIGFRMPARPVRVGVDETDAAVVLSDHGALPPPQGGVRTEDFDPLTYGRPAPTPFSAASRFDRDFNLTITKKLGFYDGKPGRQWALNGGIYPDVPMFVVARGDLVRMTITNKTDVVHPMHLHGHHALVLSRNGQTSTGSPWWTDTLDVDPGDEYVVAFRADNPGVWMDHCHNLGHAAAGLTMHLAYAGITTPFVVGGADGNTPE